MDASSFNFDFLNFKNDKTIAKLLCPGEIILITCPVYKFNEVNKRQKRNLMITTHFIYNIDNRKSTRKSAVSKVYAMTIATIGTEFIIHIPDEYDYRFSSFEHREYIVQVLIKLKGNLKVFFKKEAQLFDLTTTKIDIKKGISRQPTIGETKFNEENWSSYIQQESQQKVETRKKTQTVISRKGEEVSKDDFIVHKVLGRGGFGKVVLAEKKNTQEFYAIKEIKLDQKRKDLMKNLITEKAIMENIDHPFVVALDYLFQTPKKMYFVMPFIKGGELFHHIKNEKKFSEAKARFYITELILALEYLHSKNIIYRDLKLENILLDEKGHVRITDFGLSKILQQDQENTNTVCGTPQYVAPEVLKQNTYSFQVDWWSLGICLYIFLFGIPPFYSKNVNTMFQKIKGQQLVIPPSPLISHDAKDLLFALLEKDPILRLGSNGDSEQIKKHSWFKGVNWAKVLMREVSAPFIPKTDDEEWLSNFDQVFTSEDPRQDSSSDLYESTSPQKQGSKDQ